jgi:hypothetical protein
MTIKNVVLVLYDLCMVFCYSTDLYDSVVFLQRLIRYYRKILQMVIIPGGLLPDDDIIEAWQIIFNARIMFPKYLILAIGVWDVPTLLVFILMGSNFDNIRFHLEPREVLSVVEVRNLVFW